MPDNENPTERKIQIDWRIILNLILFLLIAFVSYYLGLHDYFSYREWVTKSCTCGFQNIPLNFTLPNINVSRP